MWPGQPAASTACAVPGRPGRHLCRRDHGRKGQASVRLGAQAFRRQRVQAYDRHLRRRRALHGPQGRGRQEVLRHAQGGRVVNARSDCRRPRADGAVLDSPGESRRLRAAAVRRRTGADRSDTWILWTAAQNQITTETMRRAFACTTRDGGTSRYSPHGLIAGCRPHQNAVRLDESRRMHRRAERIDRGSVDEAGQECAARAGPVRDGPDRRGSPGGAALAHSAADQDTNDRPPGGGTMTRAIQIGGALLLAALIAGCGGLTPAEEEHPPVEQPVDAPVPTEIAPERETEPVEVSLHVPDEVPEEAVRRFSRASASDDAGSGGIHSSVSTVQEGESFRLMVRFSGPTPINGTCAIKMVDTSGHVMADATAEANGFDASTTLIETVDDNEVTADRSITATLSSCDLGEVDYTIGEPNSVTVAVRDHDPAGGTQTVPGGAPIGIGPPEPEDDEEPWIRGDHTATIGSLSAEWEGITVVVRASVSISPALPELPVPDHGAEPNRHTGQYSIKTSWTYVEPDGTKTYRTKTLGLRSGGSVSLVMSSGVPAGTKVRVSLDTFSEWFFTGTGWGGTSGCRTTEATRSVHRRARR